MKKRRDKNSLVAVTGIGMICPLGITLTECWGNMIAGKSGVRRITRFDAGTCESKIAGEIPDKYFEAEKTLLSPKLYNNNILSSRLSMIVAKQALEDAKLEANKIDVNKAGVITGCGGSNFGDQGNYNNNKQAMMNCSYEMLNAHSDCVRTDLGFKGPSFNIATACSSSAFAIETAYHYVRTSCDVCLVIGVETMVNKQVVDGFCRLMALSVSNEFPEKASRPFDRYRTGFVISEGACAVLLESYEHAIRRGAKIYAFMSGAASASEAYNIVAPKPEGVGIAQTMELAIQNAGLDKKSVGYINAHGTSTLHNDRSESKAIKKVFGSHAYDLAVSSQKSMIGHPIGSAGAIEFAVTALSLHHQVITPTINYEEPDPECDLDYVPNEARKVQSLEVAMSNSFGFGGHNASLVLERKH